nr:uncharacterized protein CTRU02_13650 [Colletotrichum truncatum]KAF6783183.1 hypothetical protein CTRU02_13650 [Colletotrichum truncatum]
MMFPRLFSIALAACATIAQCRTTPIPYDHPDSVSCLCEDEAWHITRRWLNVFSTGGISSKAELATIVTPDVKSYDDTFGPPTIGIDQLWGNITAPGNSTTTNVTQTPSFLLHSCDQIAYNWLYTAVTTGYNSDCASWNTSLIHRQRHNSYRLAYKVDIERYLCWAMDPACQAAWWYLYSLVHPWQIWLVVASCFRT